MAVKSKTFAPPLLSGDGTLVFETINQTNDPRKSWLYPSALRRVLHSPLFGHEMHRARVVEGVLKEGARHIYGRRVFYVDKDSWQIAVADSYSTSGELWRVNEAHAMNYYTVPVLWTTLEVFHDLLAGRVLVNGLGNKYRACRFLDTADPREFSPDALVYYLR